MPENRRGDSREDRREDRSDGRRETWRDGALHDRDGQGDATDSRSPRKAGRDDGPPVALRLSAVLPDATFIACDDIVTTRACDDPDRCRPGDVFVARLTPRGDGHERVERAIARGVAGVIAERIVPTFGTPLCLVPDSTWALSRFAHAAVGDPCRKLRLIAVTGTSGKTTTAWLAASVLSEAGLRVGVLSDLGCLAADAAEPAHVDLSRPGVLATWLRQLVDDGCTHAVVEVSSAMLAAHALAGVECDTVVVTNLGSAHLDVHGTPAAYRAIKERILDCLRVKGCLVAATDDRRVRRLVARHRDRGGCAVVTAGLHGEVDVGAVPLERGLCGQTVLARAGGHMLPLSLDTPVPAFVRDALLAIAVGVVQRVPLERIARGVEAAGSVAGRLERLDRGQDHATFLDHPTSGHALAATLSGLRRLTPGRLVVMAERRVATRVIAAGSGSRGARAATAEFGRRVRRWADECLVVPETVLETGAGPADLAAYARIDRILSGLGRQDCLLVLGDVGLGVGAPVDPDDGSRTLPLATIVDGWLRLAHGIRPLAPGRHVA